MPEFTTPVGSRQRYIAALSRSQGDRVPGTKKIFVDRQDFLDRIADERACIAMGLPVWFSGIDLKILAEPASVQRLWSLSTSAGSPTANAAASHGRTVVIGAFSKVLFADASLVHATTGVPAPSLGSDGDLALDAVAGIVYEKATGAWTVLVSMYGSGGSSPVAPGAVQNLAAGTATTNSQPLSWQAPATGTGPFTYQVAYRLGMSTGAYTNFGSPVSGLSATVTGLAASTAYDYQVTAINEGGSGPAATINDASTAAGATVPDAPGAPVATAGDGTVSATWTAPASNGGSAITDYRLRWNGGTPVEMGDADLNGVIAAANGTPGTLEVAARNAIGWGDWSPASNSVTPQASGGAVTSATIATFGDSLTNRTWDTVPGGATLNASGGVGTLTIPSRSDPMLPGDLVRLTGTTNKDSVFYGEWPIATKPNATTITFNYPAGLGNASGLSFNISYGNAICVEGYVTNLINKSRQRVSIVPSLASDGERTDQILVRMQDKLPALASSLQAVTIFAGINDVSQSVAETTIIANIQALISYAATRVPFVVVYTIPASDTASAVRANVNAATRAYVSANYTSAQVVVVDAATITESGAAGSVAKAGYLIDAVHVSGTAAHLIGTAGWDALSTKYPGLAAVSPAGVNRLANGDHSAVTGNTANGVTFVNAASHTNTPSIVANPNGGNFQQLQIVATGTAGASRIERVLDLPSLTAGKRYRLWADCELVGTPVNAPDFNLAVVLDATGVAAYQGRAYATGAGLGMGGTKQNWQVPISLRGRGNWITWPAGVTDARIRLTLATVGAGTNIIRLGGVYFEEEA